MASNQKDAPDNDSQIDELMVTIGNDGYFQRRFNLLFNLALVLLLSMTYMNFIMALSVPDHHCHVPGRNASRYTLQEWHDRMLPKEIDPKTEMEGPSLCKMFKTDYYGDPTNETQECTAGWDYDPTWYSLTAPSQENWVCDRELYVADAYAATRIGEVIGVFIFGPLGDSIGRKPVFYTSLILLIIGRTLTVIAVSHYEWFLFLCGLSSVSGTIIFQTPLLIGMEISGEKVRAHLAFTQCVGWTAGICLLPLLAWLSGDWRIMIIVTTLPCAFALALYKIMPESPRWLAARGDVQGAMRVLDYIARVNNNKLPDNTQEVIQSIAKRRENTYGVASLFSNLRLAKNSTLLIICWMVSGLTYFCLVLNSTNMAGNPFVNFFLQSLVELPGYVIAQYLCNRLGRRWSHAGSYAVAVIFSIIAITTHGTATWLATAIMCAVKMCQTITYYAVLLQAIEIYPTCIRQTGTAMGGLGMNIVAIVGPYVIYWGDTLGARFMLGVLLLVSVLGAVCSSLLPETLDKKLPETLEDSKTFGASEKFWSLNRSQSTQ